MPIKSLSQSSLLNFEKYSNFLAGNTKVSYGSYDLLETEILTGSQASVTFSNLNSTYGADYQHLQIRATFRTDQSQSGAENVLCQLNANTGSNYARHHLFGGGSSVGSSASSSTTRFRVGSAVRNNEATGNFSSSVIDFLDPFHSNKNTTARILGGFISGSYYGVNLWSGLFVNTSAVDSIKFFLETNPSFKAGSRFSLYGLRSA